LKGVRTPVFSFGKKKFKGVGIAGGRERKKKSLTRKRKRLRSFHATPQKGRKRGRKKGMCPLSHRGIVRKGKKNEKEECADRRCNGRGRKTPRARLSLKKKRETSREVLATIAEKEGGKKKGKAACVSIRGGEERGKGGEDVPPEKGGEMPDYLFTRRKKKKKCSSSVVSGKGEKRKKKEA